MSDFYLILKQNEAALENGAGLRIPLKGGEPEPEVEILPPKEDAQPIPQHLPYSWPQPSLHIEHSQCSLIGVHTSPSGLVRPTQKVLPASEIQVSGGNALPQSGISPLEILRGMVAPQHRPRERWRDEAVNRIMTCDTAEVLLSKLALERRPELQKYFANGGGVAVTMAIPNGNGYASIPINTRWLWNIRAADASIFSNRLVDNLGNVIASADVDIRLIIPVLQNCPLLSFAAAYNNHDEGVIGKHAYEMAMRICEDFSLDPAEYPSKSSLPLGENVIQYSALANQNIVEGGVPFRGNGGGIRYYLQKRTIRFCGAYGQVVTEHAYVPVSPLVATGCALTRLSYVPPEHALFFRQDEISRNDGRPIFMTTQLDFAFEVASRAECIVTTAWRLEDCLGEAGVLPWGIFKGKVVHYLLIASSDATAKKHEFEMAMRICAKLKSAGTAHPQLIPVIDGQIGDAVYEEHEFWKLRNALEIEDAEMAGFPDLGEQAEVSGAPTAIDYIKQKNLMLILGEAKAGKTWMSLYLACKMAYNPEAPKTVAYFYGEGEKDKLKERRAIVKAALGKTSSEAEDEVIMVNLNDRDWGDEGFDLKLKEHQEYLDGKLREIKKELKYPLEALILDNYASIMGKSQDGNNAIKLLEFIKRYQRQGLAVLLACHTNSKGEVAGSRHLERRANGIIRLTKKSPWQEGIKQEMDAAFKKSGGKIDQMTALQIAFGECLDRIEEDEASRRKINLHVSFENFRSALPPPEEITIDIPDQSISATVVDGQVKRSFLSEYRNKLVKKMQSGKTSDADEDFAAPPPLSAQPQAPSVPPQSPYSFDEINGMSNSEEQKEALREVVKVCRARTRPELADALTVSEDTLKNFMKGKIRNEDIGLKNKAGRPSKMG